MRRSILFMAAVVVVALPGTAMALGVADIDYSVPLTPNDVTNVGAWFVGREAGTKGGCTAMSYDEGQWVSKRPWKTEISISVSPKSLVTQLNRTRYSVQLGLLNTPEFGTSYQLETHTTGHAIGILVVGNNSNENTASELSADQFHALMSQPVSFNYQGKEVTRMPAGDNQPVMAALMDCVTKTNHESP